MKKRSINLAIVLALTLGMVLCMMANCLAIKDFVCFVDTDKDGVFDEAETEYPSIAAALEATAESNAADEAEGTATHIVMIGNDGENVIIESGRNILLDLYGYVLSSSATEDSTSVIENNGTLVIQDSGSKEHKYVVNEDGLWVWNDEVEGTATPYEDLSARPKKNDIISVKGGAITGGTGTFISGMMGSTSEGGAINNRPNSSLTLKGGNLVGNTVIGVGAGIKGENSAIQIEGGRILGNVAKSNGGGVYCHNVTFSMSGGEISFNKGLNGGGMNLSWGKASLIGGKTSYNSAEYYACGVYNNANEIYVGGNVQIINNNKSGIDSNMYIQSGKLLTLGTKTESQEGNEIPVLSDKSSIGISLEDTVGKFTTNGTEDDKYQFLPDNDNIAVELNNNKTNDTSDDYLEFRAKTNYKWYYENPKESTEYTIKNTAELEVLAEIVNSGEDSFEGKTIRLADNFDGTEELTTPIGQSGKMQTPISAAIPENPFKGNFDGNGKEVKLNISDTVKRGGIFGQVDAGIIKNIYTSGTVVSKYNMAGGIAGLVNKDAIIENCCSSCTVSAVSGWKAIRFVGGIVGSNYGTVRNCFFTGTLSAKDSDGDTHTATNKTKYIYIGGIVGANNQDALTSCCYCLEGVDPQGTYVETQIAADCHAIPKSQMQGIAMQSEPEGKNWVALGKEDTYGKCSMTDALNLNAQNISGAIFWGVMTPDSYPTFTMPYMLVLKAGKAYKNNVDTEAEIVLPEGITYEDGIYTFEDVCLSKNGSSTIQFNDENAKVELEGKNQIGSLADTTNPGGENDTLYQNDIRYSDTGFSAESITFTGRGSLTIYDERIGISAGGSIAFDENYKGSVTINDFGAGTPMMCCLQANNTITIENGTFCLNNTNTCGISANKVNITGGNIKVKGSSAAINSSEKLTIADTLDVLGAAEIESETYVKGTTKVLTNMLGDMAPEYVTIVPHKWTYEASKSSDSLTYNDTIKATCANDGCPLADTSLTIQAGDATYDGNSHNASFKQTSFLGSTTLPTITYEYKAKADDAYAKTTDTKKAGLYKASFTVGEGTDAVTAYVEYSVSQQPLAVSATIVDDKTYDGTATATATLGTVDGAVEGDDLVVEIASATFDDKNVGKGKNVAVSYKISGADAVNYSVPADAQMTADITAKSIKVVAADKSSYVGSELVKLTYNAGTLCTGDSFTGALTTAADKNTAGSSDILQGTLKVNDGNSGNNYKINYTKGTYTVIAKVTQTLKFDGVSDDTVIKKYGDAKFTQIVSGAQTTVIYTSSNKNVATVDSQTGEVTIKSSGSTYIEATAEGTEKYAEATAQYELTVGKKRIYITAADKTSLVGSELEALTYTSDELCAGDSFTGALSTNADKNKAGTYDIVQNTLKVNDGDNGKNYNIVFTKGTYTVTGKELQTLTFDDVSGGTVSKKYGDAKFAKTVSGAKTAVTYSSSNENVATVDPQTGEVTIKGAGTAVIKATAAESGEYAVGTAEYALAVDQLAVTVTAKDARKSCGTADPKFTAEVTGTLGTDTVQYTISRVAGEAAGVYSIIPTGEASQGNYAVSYAAGTFTIDLALDAPARVDTKALEKIKDEYRKKSSDTSISIQFKVEKADAQNAEDIAKIQENVGNKNLEAFDASLIVKVNGVEVADAGSTNTELITVKYNFDFSNKNGIETFRVHGGKVDKLTEKPNTDGEFVSYDKDGNSITVTAAKYSTYAFAYEEITEPDESEITSVFVATAKAYKKSIKYKWTAVEGAAKYKVYVAKCGSKKYKCVKTTKSTSFTKKKLCRRKAYKAYVKAYDKNGKLIAKTPTAHAMTKGGKYSNATKITVKAELSLSQGQTKTIKAKIAAKDSKKTMLWKRHLKTSIRYYSSNKSVATVNRSGKIVAISEGTANIYAVAPSGVYAVCKVSVN